MHSYFHDGGTPLRTHVQFFPIIGSLQYIFICQIGVC